MNEELMQQQRLDTLPFDLPGLTVPGRRSGQPRRTPLTVLERDGERYVLGGFPAADWIRNVRAAGGRGTLSTSGVDEPVRLVELTADDARPVLRAWPAAAQHGVEMMRDAGVISEATSQACEEAAGICPVFRVEGAA